MISSGELTSILCLLDSAVMPEYLGPSPSHRRLPKIEGRYYAGAVLGGPASKIEGHGSGTHLVFSRFRSHQNIHCKIRKIPNETLAQKIGRLIKGKLPSFGISVAP